MTDPASLALFHSVSHRAEDNQQFVEDYYGSQVTSELPLPVTRNMTDGSVIRSVQAARYY